MSSDVTQVRSYGPYPSQSTKYWSTYPGAWNRAALEPGTPPRHRPGWVGGYGPRLPPTALLSDHQQVSAETHEMWEKYGNY